MSAKVYVYSVGMIKFGKYLEKGIKKLIGDALGSLQKDFDLGFDEIEAAWFSNSGWGYRSNHDGNSRFNWFISRIIWIPKSSWY